MIFGRFDEGHYGGRKKVNKSGPMIKAVELQNLWNPSCCVFPPDQLPK